MASLPVSPIPLDDLMRAALAEAEAAAAAGEVPVGAVIACGDTIVARAHNETEARSDGTAHAELLAIQRAGLARGNWRLEECTLVVTLEPCTMCAGAIRQARLATVVFGAADPRAGAFGSLYDLSADERLGPTPRVVSSIRKDECGRLLSSFFASRRG